MDISMEDLEQKLTGIREGLNKGDAETVAALKKAVPSYKTHGN